MAIAVGKRTFFGLPALTRGSSRPPLGRTLYLRMPSFVITVLYRSESYFFR